MSFLKHLIPLKAKASIALDKPMFYENEPVTGKVNVECNEYFQSSGVRVEARTYEHFQETDWVVENNQRVPRMVSKTNTLFSRDEPISGPSDFGQGPTRAFPFSVGTPVSRASRSGGSIEYEIKGVVAVKGRPDVTSTTQIAFSPAMNYAVAAPSSPQSGYGTGSTNATPSYAQTVPPSYQPAQGSAPYGSQASQPSPKVRCEYCQAMIDQTASFCPNCGAHR